MKKITSVVLSVFVAYCFFDSSFACDGEHLSREFEHLAIRSGVNDIEYFTHSKKSNDVRTLYVSSEAEFSLGSSESSRQVKLIGFEELFEKNDIMFSKNIGNHWPNHLFVSLEIHYTTPDAKGISNYGHVCSPLYYDQKNGEFCFLSQLQDSFRLADFCNHPPADWKTTLHKIGSPPYVKIVDYETNALECLKNKFVNNRHSEPRALSVLINSTILKSFIESSIPNGSVLELLLYRFHTYLDFCLGCQQTLQAGLHFLKSQPQFLTEKGHLPSHKFTKDCAVVLIGQANKCYRETHYEDRSARDNIPQTRFARDKPYTLDLFKPYNGLIEINKEGSSIILYSYIRKATSKQEFIVHPLRELSPENPFAILGKPVIKFSSPEVCWLFRELKDRNMYDEDAAALAPLFVVNIRELDLSGNRFGVDPNEDDGDEGFRYSDGQGLSKLMPYVGHAVFLESLNMSDNAFLDDHFSLIANNIGRLTRLTTLILSHTFCDNGHSPRFTECFAPHLTSFVALKKLDLSRNTLMLDHYLDLSAYLGDVTTLEDLDLSQNRLSRDIDGYSRRESISFTEEVLEDLQKNLLLHLPRLTKLDISNNGFEDALINVSRKDLKKSILKARSKAARKDHTIDLKVKIEVFMEDN